MYHGTVVIIVYLDKMITCQLLGSEDVNRFLVYWLVARYQLLFGGRGCWQPSWHGNYKKWCQGIYNIEENESAGCYW